MLSINDTLKLSRDALTSHRLRAALTMLGLTMGVATLITVITIVQGANAYVETKVANLGADVFQVSRMPFAVTDYEVVLKALKNKRIQMEDYEALKTSCRECSLVGASGSLQARARRGEEELMDVNIQGQSASMAEIDTRTIEFGRFFAEPEDEHAAAVCVIGATLRERLFGGDDPTGQSIKLANREFTVIGVVERGGSVLGQDTDNFAIIPLKSFLRLRGAL